MTSTDISPSAASAASEASSASLFTSNTTGTTDVAPKGMPRKRKLEDVIQSLDSAIGPLSDDIHDTRPVKRTHAPRSIYSTLVKYGIKTGEAKSSAHETKVPTLSKTPHLAAILARTATRAIPFKLPASSASTTSAAIKEFAPTSVSSFLARLSTFKLSTYANKPSSIDAVAAARCGWINDGKDRLVCELCNASWVVIGREGMNRDAANALVEKQRQQLVTMHKNLCPWKEKQCDPSIYHIPLKTPLAMGRELKVRAVTLEPALRGVALRHPLTSAQIHALITALSSIPFSPPNFLDLSDAESSVSTRNPLATPSEPSEAAILTSLFGWTIAPAASHAERPRASLHGRSASVISSISRAPSFSRASSVVSDSASRAGTPTPGARSSTSLRRPSIASLRTPSFVRETDKKADSPVLFCPLCQRRVGMWSFVTEPDTDDKSEPDTPSTTRSRAKPQRQFDVLKEHRSYCPYIVKSTVVPSLAAYLDKDKGAQSELRPDVADEPMEGWKAVLSVVSRYGLSQRYRAARGRSETHSWRDLSADSAVSGDEVISVSQNEDITGMDGVEAMVQRVKHRGGRELLKYVKGLLG